MRLTKQMLADIREYWGRHMKRRTAQHWATRYKRSLTRTFPGMNKIIPPKGRIRSPKPRRDVEAVANAWHKEQMRKVHGTCEQRRRMTRPLIQQARAAMMGSTFMARDTLNRAWRRKTREQGIAMLRAIIAKPPRDSGEASQLLYAMATQTPWPSSPEGPPRPIAPSTPGSSP